MSSTPEPLVLGIAAIERLFDEACETFTHALGDSDTAADAVDFTGSMHEMALAAGRVQAFGEALALLTGDQTWNTRAVDVLRSYLGSSPATY